MIRRFLLTAIMVCACIPAASAQTGPWSGKLDVQGKGLSLVFHLDDENPTMDSPDQGAKGIPVQIERQAGGKIVIQIPALGACYEGVWLIRQIVGTFTQMNLSFPLTLTPGEDKPARPQTPQVPFPYQTEEVSGISVGGDEVIVDKADGHTLPK